MENPSLQIGDNNWAAKDGSILGYNIIQDNYLPQPIDFTRASTATRVNESGLIESVATGVPRIDYTSGFGKLLLEPQRTNSLFYSEQFDNAAWTKGAVSVTSNNAVSPDGYTNADLITADGTTTQHYAFQFQSAAARTYSIFLKMGTQRYVQLLTSGVTTAPVANYDLQNGVANMVGSSSTASIENYGNGWYRCILSTTDAAAASFYLLFASSMTSVRYEVNNSSGTIWAYGAQAEVGSYATSYIPATSGTAVTRLADAASKTGISSLIGQTEGVLFIESAALFNDGTNRIISLNDGTSSNRIYFVFTSTNNRIVYGIVNSGVFKNTDYIVSDFTQMNKYAIRYKLNDVSLWHNGILVSSFTNVTIPATNKISSDNGSGATNYFYSKLKQVQIYKTYLTDTEMANLTTL